MNSIFRGDLASRPGRRLAWIDSLLVDHGVFRLTWTNFASVVPGRLYRSNHPTPGRLARLARQLGLRTVINLRGEARNGSDALSREAAGRLGLTLIDLALESRGIPQRDRLQRLMHVYRTMAEPALIHCKSGADRTGLAAGVFLLAEGGRPEDALAQLSLRFGHVRQAKAGVLDAFFELYRDSGRRDFAAWLKDEYDEEAVARRFRAGRFASFVTDKVLARE